MDVLTFISNLVSHLALPVTAIIALRMLLNRAHQIARFVKSVRYKDVEINLRDKFENAKAAVVTIESSKPSPEKLTRRTTEFKALENDKILHLAQIDSGVAISEIWKNVESTIIKLMQHNGLMRFTRPEMLVAWLESQGKLGSAEVQLFRKLREIRNTAVHGGSEVHPISLAEVVEFKEFSDVFIERIEEIRNESNYLNFPIPNPSSAP